MASRDPAPATGDEWQLACTEVKQRGAALLREGQWADCTLLLGAQRTRLPAHRLLLAMVSPVFAAMFYGDLGETTVVIPDVQPETFKVLLGYIYSDDVSISSFSLCCDLFYAARKYMLSHLAKVCSTYMCNNLTPHDACRAYEIAHLFDEKKLMTEAMKMITSKTKDVLNSDDFVEAELSTVVHIFSTEPLDIDSELDLFSAAERYTRAQGNANNNKKKSIYVNQLFSGRSDNKDVTIRSALEKIRFLALSSQQFAEGPAQSSLLTKNEIFTILLNISSKNISTPMPSGFSTSREKRTKRQVAVANQERKQRKILFPLSVGRYRRFVTEAAMFRANNGSFKGNFPPEWRILVKLITLPSERYLGVFICQPTRDKYYVDVKLQIIPRDPSEQPFERTFKHIFQTDELDWGFPQFMLWNDAWSPPYTISDWKSFDPKDTSPEWCRYDSFSFDVHIVYEIFRIGVTSLDFAENPECCSSSRFL